MEVLVGAKAEARVAGNQRQVPVIQSPDATQTQSQQNTNKVLRNLSNQIDSIQSDINEMTIIGEIKIVNLTPSQFQGVAGNNWLLTNGQSCVGTKYSVLTGNNTVPTLSLGAVNNYIRVN